MAIVAIFVRNASKDKVAITTIEGEITIIGIFALGIHNSHSRDSFMENLYLFKNTLVPVDFSTIVETIPLIAPPLLRFVDRKRNILVVCRNNLLPREFTFAMVWFFVDSIPVVFPCTTARYWVFGFNEPPLGTSSRLR